MSGPRETFQALVRTDALGRITLGQTTAFGEMSEGEAQHAWAQEVAALLMDLGYVVRRKKRGTK